MQKGISNKRVDNALWTKNKNTTTIISKQKKQPKIIPETSYTTVWNATSRPLVN